MLFNIFISPTFVGWASGILFGLAIALTLGGGAYVNLPYEYTLARCCYAFAFLLLLIKAGYWLAFERGNHLSSIGAVIAACFVFGSIGGLWVLSSIWVADREAAIPREDKSIKSGDDHPNIGASLVIDDISKEYISFHIDLNNAIGSPEVNNLRYSIATPDATNTQAISPLARTLQPGRNFVIEPPPFTLKDREYNNLRLVLLCLADIEGEQHEFKFTYRFLFGRKLAKKGNTISPEAANHEEISNDEIEKENKEDLQSRFSRSVGSLFLVLDEKTPNGKINKVFGSDGKKSFLFDPEHRIVSFSFIVNGQTKTISQPLKETPSHRHLVALKWNDQTGGHLDVDKSKNDSPK
jgi:hypothetical protein